MAHLKNIRQVGQSMQICDGIETVDLPNKEAITLPLCHNHCPTHNFALCSVYLSIWMLF